MKIFVVDTHVLVWFLSKDKRLSPKVGDILESPEVLLLIPTIVLAEITHLYRKGRITQSLEKVWQFLQTGSRCIIYPIDFNVVLKMPVNLDIHDGLIVGTALAYPTKVTGILTCDEMITHCGLVPVVWQSLPTNPIQPSKATGLLFPTILRSGQRHTCQRKNSRDNTPSRGVIPTSLEESELEI